MAYQLAFVAEAQLILANLPDRDALLRAVTEDVAAPGRVALEDVEGLVAGAVRQAESRRTNPKW